MNGKKMFCMILILAILVLAAGCGTGDVMESEPNAQDSESESTVSDGCYISTLLGSYQGDPMEGAGTCYEITEEDGQIIVRGSFNYNVDPELTWIEDSTDLMINSVVRFPYDGDTKFVASGGDAGDEPFASVEEFLARAQEFMDTDNGLGLIVSVREGKAVRIAMAS